MSRKKLFLMIPVGIVLIAALLFGWNLLNRQNREYGFAREVPEAEAALRMKVVETAQRYLGYNESDGTHKTIIDLYNAQEDLPMGYQVQYTDQWCAAYGSVVALQCGLTDIIPLECGCQRQVGLFQELDRWQEEDDYVPLPGDYIFYHTGHVLPGDCADWSDHVGIVVGVWKNYIKVIEGNCNEEVAYRIIPLGDNTIRGFGLPDYSAS